MQASADLLAGHVSVNLIRGVAFAFGAIWGSFFNVAIYRWPRGMSVVRPPSHCPACGAPVRWYLNLPILGYLLLRGRARCCGAPLRARYLWVETLSGVLGRAVAERFIVNREATATLSAGGLDALLYFAFVGGLVIATFVDLEWMEIPDEVSLPGAALGLATVGLRTGPGPLSAAIGAGVGFLLVQVLFVWVYELATGRRGMGEGDAKLLLMIGAFLGWEAVLFALVAGSFQGLIAAGLATAFGVPLVPSRPDEPVPPSTSDVGANSEAPADTPSAPMMVFGPMLTLSALEFLFFGDAVVAWVSLRLGG